MSTSEPLTPGTTMVAEAITPMMNSLTIRSAFRLKLAECDYVSLINAIATAIPNNIRNAITC